MNYSILIPPEYNGREVLTVEANSFHEAARIFKKKFGFEPAKGGLFLESIMYRKLSRCENIPTSQPVYFK